MFSLLISDMEEFITPLSFPRFEEELKLAALQGSGRWVHFYVDHVAQIESENPDSIEEAVLWEISEISKNATDSSPSTETRLRQFLMTLQVATAELLLSAQQVPWLSDLERAKLRLVEQKHVYQLSTEQVLSETRALLETVDPRTAYILYERASDTRELIDESCRKKVLIALADLFETREWRTLSVLQDDGEDDPLLPVYYKLYNMEDLTHLLRKPEPHELRMTLKVESMSGVKRTIYLNRTKLEVFPGQTFESLENMIDFLSRVFPAHDVQNEPPPSDISWP
jgi:hypothetical protein